jgi:penicillin amidase
MNRARTCAEFREALRGWAAPVQNVVYADVDGNIGYSFPGKIPIRSQSDGRTPVPGWTRDYEWQGYIPFDDLPHLDNPPQGYIASANNAVVDHAYPYDLAVRPGTGNRAERIVELIESRPTLDVEFIKQMHIDVLSPMARRVSRLVGSLDVDQRLAPVVNLLDAWDGTLSRDSAAGAVYEIFIREMASLLLSEALQQESPYREGTWWWLEHILDEPDASWFDLGNGETRDDVMRIALDKAVNRLEATCGPTPQEWAWGDLNKMTYGHVLGENPTLGSVFSRGPYAIPGDTHTICATHHGDLADLTVSGAPYRMIVDLGDVRNSVSALTPGQSGHLGSPHYDDQIASWSAGEYHPMLFAREDVEREAHHRLHLIPKPPAS